MKRASGLSFSGAAKNRGAASRLRKACNVSRSSSQRLAYQAPLPVRHDSEQTAGCMEQLHHAGGRGGFPVAIGERLLQILRRRYDLNKQAGLAAVENRQVRAQRFSMFRYRRFEGLRNRLPFGNPLFPELQNLLQDRGPSPAAARQRQSRSGCSPIAREEAAAAGSVRDRVRRGPGKDAQQHRKA